MLPNHQSIQRNGQVLCQSRRDETIFIGQGIAIWFFIFQSVQNRAVGRLSGQQCNCGYRQLRPSIAPLIFRREHDLVHRLTICQQLYRYRRSHPLRHSLIRPLNRCGEAGGLRFVRILGGDFLTWFLLRLLCLVGQGRRSRRLPILADLRPVEVQLEVLLCRLLKALHRWCNDVIVNDLRNRQLLIFVAQLTAEQRNSNRIRPAVCCQFYRILFRAISDRRGNALDTAEPLRFHGQIHHNGRKIAVFQLVIALVTISEALFQLGFGFLFDFLKILH